MIDVNRPLLLCSASPRRRELLAIVGIPTLVRPVDVDETRRSSEGPGDYLARVVREKLEAAGRLTRGRESALLVADTAVVCDGTVLGKPKNEADACAMLKRLSGREHEVSTRFAVVGASLPLDGAHVETVTTLVRFRSLTADHIRRYAATGEGADKAGAYAIQGIGSFAVERIVGSYSNVVGLPICEVVAALEKMGLLARFPIAAGQDEADAADASRAIHLADDRR